MKKTVRILEYFIYMTIGAIGGRVIFDKDWVALAMTIILFILVVTCHFIFDMYYREKE